LSAKRRADQLLAERGLAESRARAQALILAGLVYAGGRRIDKAGDLRELTRWAAALTKRPGLSRGMRACD